MKTRTLLTLLPLMAGLAVAVYAADWYFNVPPPETDPRLYEGKGGIATLPWGSLRVPDLAPVARTRIPPQTVLGWRGRQLGQLTTDLGPPTSSTKQADGSWACLWADAVPITSLETGQRSAGHVLIQVTGPSPANIPGDSCTAESIAVIGSLGRILGMIPEVGMSGAGPAPGAIPGGAPTSIPGKKP